MTTTTTRLSVRTTTIARQKKLNSKERRKQKRMGGMIAVIPFDRENGAGTVSHEIECERCGRRYAGGEQAPIKDRPCVCGYEYARYVALSWW